MAGMLQLQEGFPTAEGNIFKPAHRAERKVLEDCLDETQPNWGAIYGITECKVLPGTKCTKEGSYWTTEYSGNKIILIWKFTIMVHQFCFKYTAHTEGEVFPFNTGTWSSVFLDSCHVGQVENIMRLSKGMLDSLIENSNKQMLVMNSYQIY